jgi:hypothetical protein
VDRRGAAKRRLSVGQGDPGDVDVVGVAEVHDGLGGAVAVVRVVAVALEEIARAVERTFSFESALAESLTGRGS